MNEIPSILIPEKPPARRRTWLLAGALLLILTVGSATAWMFLHPRSVRGTITLPEATFFLKDGRATWQPDSGWLILYLSPHRLSHKVKVDPADDADSASSRLIHRAGGSVELTLVLSMENGPGFHIETVSFAVSSPSAPDASRIFVQGHGKAPWIHGMIMTNGPGGGFVSVISSGTCSDEKGAVSWDLQVKKLPLETLE